MTFDPMYKSRAQDVLEQLLGYNVDEILAAYSKRANAAKFFNHQFLQLRDLMSSELIQPDSLRKDPQFQGLCVLIDSLVTRFKENKSSDYELDVLRLSLLVRMSTFVAATQDLHSKNSVQEISAMTKRVLANDLSLDSPMGQKLLDSLFECSHKELLLVFKNHPRTQEAIRDSLNQFLRVFQDAMRSENHDAMGKMMKHIAFQRFRYLGKRIIDAHRAIQKNGEELPKMADKLTEYVYFVLHKVASSTEVSAPNIDERNKELRSDVSKHILELLRKRVAKPLSRSEKTLFDRLVQALDKLNEIRLMSVSKAITASLEEKDSDAIQIISSVVEHLEKA